jgi:hypothetical protein
MQHINIFHLKSHLTLASHKYKKKSTKTMYHCYCVTLNKPRGDEPGVPRRPNTGDCLRLPGLTSLLLYGVANVAVEFLLSFGYGLW